MRLGPTEFEGAPIPIDIFSFVFWTTSLLQSNSAGINPTEFEEASTPTDTSSTVPWRVAGASASNTDPKKVPVASFCHSSFCESKPNKNDGGHLLSFFFQFLVKVTPTKESQRQVLRLDISPKPLCVWASFSTPLRAVFTQTAEASGSRDSEKSVCINSISTFSVIVYHVDWLPC